MNNGVTTGHDYIQLYHRLNGMQITLCPVHTELWNQQYVAPGLLVFWLENLH